MYCSQYIVSVHVHHPTHFVEVCHLYVLCLSNLPHRNGTVRILSGTDAGSSASVCGCNWAIRRVLFVHIDIRQRTSLSSTT
jgi:hypothetical protein